MIVSNMVYVQCEFRLCSLDSNSTKHTLYFAITHPDCWHGYKVGKSVLFAVQAETSKDICL